MNKEELRKQFEKEKGKREPDFNYLNKMIYFEAYSEWLESKLLQSSISDEPKELKLQFEKESGFTNVLEKYYYEQYAHWLVKLKTQPKRISDEEIEKKVINLWYDDISRFIESIESGSDIHDIQYQLEEQKLHLAKHLKEQ